jgi:hypothetical protein
MQDGEIKTAVMYTTQKYIPPSNAMANTQDENPNKKK